MLCFRRMRAFQKFACVHGSIHNHFAERRQLLDRQIYKERCSAALAEWKSLAQ
jgi:putative transposase